MVIEKVEGINGILPYSMNISDWDADGFKDLIILLNQDISLHLL